MPPLTKDDLLKDFTIPERETRPIIDAEDLKRSMIEEQVQNLRSEARSGKKPPAIANIPENPKNEALTGKQMPRMVGLPPGTLESGAEATGAAAAAQAGAMRGLQIGSRFGPYGAAIGTVGGGLLGAGLGLAGTRGVIEEGKALTGVRPPITAEEAITRGRRAMMEGIAGEGAFRGIAAIPQAGRYLRQRLLAGDIAHAERALYEQAQGLGIHLTPSTLTESKSPKLIESTLRRTLSGSGKFEARDIENEINLRKAVDTWADDAMRQYHGPVEQGQLVQKALKNEVIPQHRELVRNLYKNLDNQTGNAKIVETGELYKTLQDIRASLARRGDTHASAISTLDDVLERMSKEGPSTGLTVKRIEGEPTAEGAAGQLQKLKVTEKSKAPREPIPLTFSEAQEIRTIIGSEIGHGGQMLPANDTKKLRETYALMTEHMANAAIDFTKATGKDVNLSWALADTMNRRGKELFNESVVAKVIERNPEDVVKTVFQKNAITETRDLVRALETRPEVLQQYRRGVVEELIQESTNKNTERVVGTDFAKNARKRGEAVLKETFGENYEGFRKILEIAERMPKESGAGMLWFEQGLYIGGLATALAGHVFESTGAVIGATAAPAAFFFTTKRLATVLTDKDLTNRLLSAYRMDPKSQAFFRTMNQLGAIEVGETGTPVEGRPEPRRGLVTGLTQTLLQ